MTYLSNELSMQSYKQQFQYQTTVTAVQNQPQIDKNANEIDASKVSENLINSPIVYTNQNDLPMVDKVKKMLMESILGSFTKEGDSFGLFPNDNVDVSKDHQSVNNPYTQSVSHSPYGLVYESSQEYYEKTSIEFNAQATIKTPQGEYQIEINFSYTQEFYEKHETQIYYAHSNFEKPFEINLDEDDGSLKGVTQLDLLFDILADENKEEKNLLNEIKELFYQRQQLILKSIGLSNANENHSTTNGNRPFDNFRVFEQQSHEHSSLLTIQKDGMGIFLANSHNSSKYFNATADKNSINIQSGFSYEERKHMSIINDLTA